MIENTAVLRGFTKTGLGTLILSGANTYAGGTTLTGGQIDLGADNVIPDTGTFTFAGGILAANNRTDTIGQLSLTADSSLNLSPGGAVGALTFASAAWTSGTLTISGWTGTPGEEGTDDRIYFTSTPGSDFLDHVYFDIGGNLYFADMIGNELVAGVTPVPEPVNVALGVFGAMFAAIGLWRRHRATHSA
ncbi:MAG: autotransporter-associated beta strand repeat-containing protein [Verrucomicrobiae bacterium]|nr:autotransporter-associated beta strand repeat-containing protein [Verrucomicrobiae bacterium]